MSAGNLYLREPKGLGVAKDGRTNALVIRVPVVFSGPMAAVK